MTGVTLHRSDFTQSCGSLRGGRQVRAILAGGARAAGTGSEPHSLLLFYYSQA